MNHQMQPTESIINRTESTDEKIYDSYTGIMRRAADLSHAAAVLEWDQEIYMPPKSAGHRAGQLATLASMAHELVTNEDFGKLLLTLENIDELDYNEETNIDRSQEDYEKNKKLSAGFVEELSHQTSECFNAWIAARKQNDFQVFAPSLTKMIALKRRQADLYGFAAHPYDALLDDYEKGATVAMLDPLFAGIKDQLPPLIAKISGSPQVSKDCFHQHFPRQQQWDFGIEVLKAMGFDFEAGRQDYSEHPFTTSFSATDVRLTTRVDENNFASMLWSCIHEGGHGLYEQGLPEEQYGLPLGSPASLGIHESQSRFWENCIGRGLDFWTGFYPTLQQYFPQQLANISLDTFYKAANRVEPSLIRTEADEVTYHFHVLIRYEIEKALIEGTLNAENIPARWNELYFKYLGVTPKDDYTGVLQDVHWSHGSFGYFPTYTLGSFYAAQFYARALQDIPRLKEQVTKGNFKALLLWLRENVHRHGRRYTSEELCERITGERLNTSFFMRYVEEKYESVYGR
jgi:carboxypeptidase Taq